MRDGLAGATPDQRFTRGVRECSCSPSRFGGHGVEAPVEIGGLAIRELAMRVMAHAAFPILQVAHLKPGAIERRLAERKGAAKPTLKELFLADTPRAELDATARVDFRSARWSISTDR